MAIPTLATAALAVAGAFVTGVYQFFADRFQRKQAQRDAELKKANEVFEELSALMDSFAYYNQELVYSLVLRRRTEAEDRIAWDKYVKAEEAWTKVHSRLLAQTAKHFGGDARKRLEDISKDFDTMKRQVRGTHSKRVNNPYYLLVEAPDTSEEDRELDRFPRYRKYQEKWQAVARSIQELNELMIGKIQTVSVGELER